MSSWHIYTDGSGKGGWAFVLYLDRDEFLYRHGVLSPKVVPTNNRAEAMAVIEAFNYIESSPELFGDSIITIHADSSYALNGLLGTWNVTTNPDIWNVLRPLYDRLRSRIKLRHVKGHSGDVGNTRADYLATIASKSFGQVEEGILPVSTMSELPRAKDKLEKPKVVRTRIRKV